MEAINNTTNQIAQPSKPWSIAQFQLYRHHNVDFCEKEIIPHINSHECRRILIRAPVKSGKREFAEYLALRDFSFTQKKRHVFVSAWHREADEEQRDELKEHNLDVFSINNKKNTSKCLQYLKDHIENGIKVVVHLDECDHGAGSRQLLSQIWRLIRDHDDILVILYSATPEEALLSKDFEDSTDYDNDYEELLNEFEDEAVIVTYKPPLEFCGPNKFLDEGLVYNAKPFFEKTGGSFQLTNQGREIIKDFEESIKHDKRRNIMMIRLSYSDKNTKKNNEEKRKKSIYQFLSNIDKFPELKDYLIVADDDGIKFPKGRGLYSCEKVKWSDPIYWKKTTTDMPVIVVYDQTSSRSTEWKCHDRIFATHDFRHTVTFSVLSQAQERVNHYSTKYGEFQSIRVYGHLPTFQLSAGRINYGDYMNLNYKIKENRTSKRFEIVNVVTSETETVSYDSESQAEYRLMELGCYAKPTLSMRVIGNSKKVVTCDSVFVACDQTTFDRLARPTITEKLNGSTTVFTNPFLRANEYKDGEQWKGYLRGWKVLDYNMDVKDSGWGFKIRDVTAENKRVRIHICYKDGVLGVGFRIPVGTKETDNLSSVKSMYPGK
jgi:hypothetical protein